MGKVRGRARASYLNGLAAVGLWSTVATAFKLSLRVLHPTQLLFFATVSSAGVLALVLLLQGRLAATFRGLTGKQALTSAGLGVLNPFLYYLVLFQAYDRLPAQVAQPLNYTWAITLSLLAIPLQGQRPTARDLAGIVVAYAGVVAIATRGELLEARLFDPLGVALALGSTVIWALYWIANARDDRDPVAGLLFNFLFAIPLTLAAALLGPGLAIASPWGLVGGLYVGVFEMGVTFVLWLRAMRLTPSTARLSSLIFISPFLSLFFIQFILGEPIHPFTLAGLCLIVAGVALQQVSTHSTKSVV
mgnify:CR=1 FL=1